MPTHSSRTGKCHFIDIWMGHDLFAHTAVASKDVDDTIRQARLLTNLGEQQRSERSVFGWLEHHGISHSQSWGDFPR